MKLRNVLAATAALSLMAAPAMAAPAPVQARTASVAPASERVDGDNALNGGGAFVAIAAAIAVILGIIVVANEDDKPTSP